MRFSVLAALLLMGCGASHRAPQSEAPDTTRATLTIGTSSEVTVNITGAERSAADVLPTRCGEDAAPVRGGQDNIAIVEVKNPNDSPAAISLTLEGPSINSALFAYASADPPATAEDAVKCLQWAQTTFDLDSRPIAPALSAASGRGLVVPARSSRFVLVAAGDATGTFTLKSVTDAVAPAAPPIDVPALGATASSTVLVGGDARSSALPTRCGDELTTIRSGVDNFVFVEVKNPNEAPASVSLAFDGPETSSALYVFDSPTAPASVREAVRCLQSSVTMLDVNGRPIQPSLASAAGRSLVVPGRASAFVLVATGSATGAFALHATTDAFAPADRGSVVVGSAATALVSGAQRAGAIPRRCGDGAPLREGTDNFAFVEVKNPGDAPASVSLTIDGPDGNNGLFAYTSPMPPATLHDALGCVASDESALVADPKPHITQPSLSAVSVPAHGSVFVLLATATGTGAFTFHALPR